MVCVLTCLEDREDIYGIDLPRACYMNGLLLCVHLLNSDMVVRSVWKMVTGHSFRSLL